MSYSDSLRQQAKWIREAIDDPAPMKSFRFDLGDVDTDELDAAADHIDALVKALEFYASPQKFTDHIPDFYSELDFARTAEDALSQINGDVGTPPTGERT